MMISRIQKHCFITTLITLLITLQTTTTANAANINSGKQKDTNNNYAAVIKGTDSARIKEDDDPDNDNLLEASGKLSITDRDSGEAAFIATVSNGNYGNLVIAAAGNWYYAADNTQSIIQNLTNSDSLKETLTVSSIDGTTHPIVITIKGVNESNITDSSTNDINNPAVISGSDSGSVTEDVDPDGDSLLEVSGKLNISDSDNGEAAFNAKTVNGNYGNLTINAAGDWNYSTDNTQSVIQNLPGNATLTDSLTVSSVDGTTHTVTITIIGVDEPNNAAVISGVDNGSVTEDVDPDGDNLLEVSGKLNITDSDNGEAAFNAKTVNGNYGSLTINAAGSWNYAASNSQPAIQNLSSGATLKDNLIVSSVDGTAHTVSITINGADESTVADIHLSWVAPAEREDNSPLSLSEIVGYKIYYGSTQGQYANNVNINDGSAEGYTFTGLSTGTYYFVVIAIDTNGRESQYSAEVKVDL